MIFNLTYISPLFTTDIIILIYSSMQKHHITYRPSFQPHFSPESESKMPPASLSSFLFFSHSHYYNHCWVLSQLYQVLFFALKVFAMNLERFYIAQIYLQVDCTISKVGWSNDLPRRIVCIFCLEQERPFSKLLFDYSQLLLISAQTSKQDPSKSAYYQVSCNFWCHVEDDSHQDIDHSRG